MVCPLESRAQYRNRCLPLMLMYVSSSRQLRLSFSGADGSAYPFPDRTPEPIAKCNWPKSQVHARLSSPPCAPTKSGTANTSERTAE
jgi:hypothetical protein